MEGLLNVTFSSTPSSLDAICEANSSFDKGVLKIAYHGLNENGSNISKEAFERAIPSIYNCPIVCHYNRDDDSMGGHDVELVQDEDGDFDIVNATHPVGCIPESASVWFEDVEEEDGTVHEYLFADALLWKRQEAYKKIKKDGFVSQSMEIEVKTGRLEDNVFYIDDFEFNSFALIGVEPCFESASLEVFSKKEFKKELSEMMSELKESYIEITSTQKINEEGGKQMEDTNKEVFELSRNIREELEKEVSKVKFRTPWGGEEHKYYFFDYDEAIGEVYVFDTEEDGALYGFSYTHDGDNVVIDYESKKRKKLAVVDFVEGEEDNTAISAIFEDISNAKTSVVETEEKLTEAENNYAKAKENIEALEDSVEKLEAFKLETEKAALEADALERANEVFAKFAELNDIEEFSNFCSTVRANATEYDPSGVEEKCYAIKGRYEKFSADNSHNTIKIKVSNNGVDNSDAEPYGNVFKEYKR